ncbi:hypothetical protein T484DRAFT_3153116 [Baffinella frigidus]|nr:hypothetical protein T484DRAFT_3153116 [Cryptophyta sp. CCMP2293]
MFDTSDEAERQPAQPQYKDEDTKDKMEAWMSRAAPAPVFPESLYILPGDAESAEVDTGASKVDTFPAQTGDKLTEPPRLEPLVESPLASERAGARQAPSVPLFFPGASPLESLDNASPANGSNAAVDESRRTEQWLSKIDTFFSKVDLSLMPVYDISDDDEEEDGSHPFVSRNPA